MQIPTALCQFLISKPILLRRPSEKCVTEGSKNAHWIRLYLSFHLSWVFGPFVHGRLQNLQKSEDTLEHVLTPLHPFSYLSPCTGRSSLPLDCSSIRCSFSRNERVLAWLLSSFLGDDWLDGGFENPSGELV